MQVLNYIKQNILAFWISLFYVASGAVVACSLYPNDPLNGSWLMWGLIITFPVSIISCAYRFTIGLEYFPVIIIQIIMFVPAFLLISKIFRRKPPIQRQ